MIRRVACLVLVYLFFITSFSQSKNNYFGKRIVVGVSGTYIGLNDGLYHRYREITGGIQTSVSITKSINLGAQVLSIYSNGTNVYSNTFFVKGVFLNYDFFPKKDYHGYFEIAYNQGNYCTCGNLDPYKKEGLHYYGFGGGFDYPLFNSNFYGNIAMMFHRIIGPINLKSGYNIYKIGVNYHFGKKNKND